jgi:hypothetical protein
MANLASEIISDADRRKQNLSTKRVLWDEVERLFHNQLNDTQSAATKSQVFDPKLSTLVLERSYRVMSQLGTGKVRGVSENDVGGAVLKNLLLDKYVIPNANAQFDFLTKLRMIDMYSNIYGNFFTLVDWDVRKDGYVGPDLWLLNIRDVFPQEGRVSIEDSDDIIIRTWKPLSYFEGLKEGDNYKNIGDIVDKLKLVKSARDKRDASDTSKREENQYAQGRNEAQKGLFEVYSRFEKDRWVDVCVDADMEFRDVDNPHGNGELPVVCKYSIPLIDDFMGMGDMERGKPMQMTVNSIWNLYLDACKMSIFPPVLLNKDNIASMSSIKMGAAEKWLVRNQITNAAQVLPLAPQGIQTFNNVYQVATASILNMFGTTDTTVTSQTDPGMGKTPDAIKMQAQRENTRDNADRFYMEQFITKVMKKFVNLLCKKQTSAVTVRLFPDEIAQLQRSYPEIADIYDEKTGKATIKKGDNKTLYDYELVSGSTFAADQKQQQENMAMLLKLFQQSQTPQGNILVQTLQQEGYNFKFGELFKRIVSNSGIQDWDKILEEQTQEEKDNVTLDQTNNQFQAALQQMMGNPNQTPISPDQANQPANPAANGMSGMGGPMPPEPMGQGGM